MNMVEFLLFKILIRLADLLFGYIRIDLVVGLKLVYIMDLNQTKDDQSFIWKMVKLFFLPEKN